MEAVAKSSPDRSLPFAGMRVLVVGLGRFGGGVGVTRWLVEQGARVTVTDMADHVSLSDSLKSVSDLDLTLHLGAHDPRDLLSTDWAVVNPAVVKATSPFFQEILRRGIDWTTEMNLFCQRCPAVVIGVTGTYGKSTTCAMLADALRAGFGAGAGRPLRNVAAAPRGGRSGVENAPTHGDSAFVQLAGRRVYLGGNIGQSLLGELRHLRPDDLVVLEMSNAQLEDLPRIDWTPTVAVINNLWPHHLDRHASFEAYIAAKLNLLGGGRHEQTAIIGDLASEAEVALERFAGREMLRVQRVVPPKPPVELHVPGAHNRANAATVLSVCEVLGLPESVVRESLRSFPGLPHRLQWIRRIDEVDYINDSKSTSPRTTLAAIGSISRPIVAIVGGKRKDSPLAEWAGGVASACRCVVCFGEAGQAFATALRDAGNRGDGAQILVVDHLADAVSAARAAAGPGDAVVLSPGAPSFDAYHNYAERGEHFIRLIQAI